MPVYYHEFADEDEALRYAIANQRDRRNLTDTDLLRLIEAVDNREKRGGDRGNQYAGGNPSREGLPPKGTAEQTAKIVGTSRSKVEKARVILDEAKTNPTVKEEVLSGKTWDRVRSWPHLSGDRSPVTSVSSKPGLLGHVGRPGAPTLLGVPGNYGTLVQLSGT